MQQRTLKQRQIVVQLQNMVSKLKLQSPEFHDLDISVLPDFTGGSSYIIDVSKGRFSRRVILDLKTIERSGRSDSSMLQELGNAMRTVTSWAHNHK